MEVCDITRKKQILHVNLKMDKLVNIHDLDFSFFKRAILC